MTNAVRLAALSGWPRRVYRARNAAISSPLPGQASTTRDRSPRLCASTVAADKTRRGGAPPSSALHEQLLFTRELAIHRVDEPLDHVLRAERERTAQRAGAYAEPFAVVTRDRAFVGKAVFAHLDAARRDPARVPLRDVVDDVAGCREALGALDLHPRVMANPRVDVGGHERRDRREVRREQQSQVREAILRAVDLGRERARHGGGARILPEPGRRVLDLLDDELRRDS